MTSASTYHNRGGLDMNLLGMDHVNSTHLTGTQQNKEHRTTPTSYEIEDPIYGKVSIDSPCAIEIIHLPEFQRLKKVLQHGITGLIGLLPSPLVNRFDHSVGAMLLVRHVGGSEEAQLAALLHDASHTALSHVADSVFGYVVHEVEKVDYLSKTQIPSVLKKHGFDPCRVFQEELFPLLESPSPQLCADRLDYALRDSVSFGYMSLSDAQMVYNSTIAVEGRMVLNSIGAARVLGEGYMKSDRNVWADGCQAYLYKLAAKAIKLSIGEGSIEKKHLWEFGDQEFWNLLERNAIPQVKSIIDRINPRCYLEETKDTKIMDQVPQSPDGFSEILNSESHTQTICRLKLRVRTIDPLVQTQNSLVSLTCLDEDYQKLVVDYARSRQSPITYLVHYRPSSLPKDAQNSPPQVVPLAAR